MQITRKQAHLLCVFIASTSNCSYKYISDKFVNFLVLKTNHRIFENLKTYFHIDLLFKCQLIFLYIIGEPCHSNWQEKTIMLVGATGSGKSTMVDSLINYILGVNFNDPFRFSMVNLEEEEKLKKDNQV